MLRGIGILVLACVHYLGALLAVSVLTVIIAAIAIIAIPASPFIALFITANFVIGMRDD